MRSLALLLCLAAGLAAQTVPAASAPAPRPSDPPAPETYQVRFHTTSGDFTIAVTRAWAPHGADRFYALVQAGYYGGNALYRVIPGFVVQWGLSPVPAITAKWLHANIPDDPVVKSNTQGTVTFADSGPNTRTTQVFINLGDNPRLDRLGFAVFGKVIAGMDVANAFFGDYGDGPPRGRGPDQGLITTEGAAYLTRLFPRLDIIYSASIVPAPPAGER